MPRKVIEPQKSVAQTIAGELNGKPYELREPTLADLPKIEIWARERGHGLNDLNRVSQIELFYFLFCVACIKYGDAESISYDELIQLPLSCIDEVSNAVGSFRGLLEL